MVDLDNLGLNAFSFHTARRYRSGHKAYAPKTRENRNQAPGHRSPDAARTARRREGQRRRRGAPF